MEAKAAEREAETAKRLADMKAKADGREAKATEREAETAKCLADMNAKADGRNIEFIKMFQIDRDAAQTANAGILEMLKANKKRLALMEDNQITAVAVPSIAMAAMPSRIDCVTRRSAVCSLTAIAGVCTMSLLMKTVQVPNVSIGLPYIVALDRGVVLYDSMMSEGAVRSLLIIWNLGC